MVYIKSTSDWMQPDKGWGYSDYVTEDIEESEGRAGRFGPDAPDIEQSPIVHTIDTGNNTHSWRSSVKDECHPNTFIDEEIFKDKEMVDKVERGEVAIGSASEHRAGVKRYGHPYPLITTHLNNLRLSFEGKYMGIVGNPSRANGSMATGRRGVGMTLGTAAYGGGSLTTYNNSTRTAFAGQQVFMLLEGTVSRVGNKVLGNRWWYVGMPRRGNQQVKIMPTTLPVDIDSMENIQSTLIYQFMGELTHMLSPAHTVTSSSPLWNYRTKVLDVFFANNGLTLMQDVREWIAVWLLMFALTRAFFFWKHPATRTTAGGEDKYANLTKSLYTQLADAMQEVWRRELHKHVLSEINGDDYSTVKSTMSRYEDRLPIKLDENAYANLMNGPDEPELGMEEIAARVLHMLERGQCMLVTLHNRVFLFFQNRWMGTVASACTQAGHTLKIISRN